MNYSKIENEPYSYKNKNVKFSLDEFLQVVEAYPDNFINYCEILITQEGEILFCIPSHMETLIRLFGFKDMIDLQNHYEREGKIHELYDLNLYKETGAISVYYNMQIFGKDMTEIQHKVLLELDSRNLINFNLCHS